MVDDGEFRLPTPVSAQSPARTRWRGAAGHTFHGMPPPKLAGWETDHTQSENS